MTTIHAQLIGDQALLPRRELEQLLELACRSEEVRLQLSEEDVSTLTMMQLAEQGGAFDFWREDGEDIYYAQDGDGSQEGSNRTESVSGSDFGMVKRSVTVVAEILKLAG